MQHISHVFLCFLEIKSTETTKCCNDALSFLTLQAFEEYT